MSTDTTHDDTSPSTADGGAATPPRLASLTFDCGDAPALARFWAALLERPLVDEGADDYVQVQGSPPWTFINVPEGKATKNRVHVDLDVADLPAAVDRAVGLGATRLGDFDEGGYRWVTLADPEGNEFDLAVAAS
jgi:hypothetical protein